MERITQLQALYSAYHQKATQVRRSAKLFDGVFGLGEDPRKDPCHDGFYGQVSQWTDALVAAAPEGPLAAAAVQALLELPEKYREQEGYWYMFACIGFAEKLLPFLCREDAARLAALFKSLYPRHERLPVQKRVLKLLIKAGK